MSIHSLKKTFHRFNFRRWRRLTEDILTPKTSLSTVCCDRNWSSQRTLASEEGPQGAETSVNCVLDVYTNVHLSIKTVLGNILRAPSPGVRALRSPSSSLWSLLQLLLCWEDSFATKSGQPPRSFELLCLWYYAPACKGWSDALLAGVCCVYEKGKDVDWDKTTWQVMIFTCYILDKNLVFL